MYRIRLTTTALQSQTYEGALFTACPILNVVAINTRNTSSNATVDAAEQSGDYSIIPIAKIQNLQILSLTRAAEGGDNGFFNAASAIGPVDTKRLKERENARIAELKEQDEHRGKGVTKEAQAIYDSFKRMYEAPSNMLFNAKANLL